MPVDSIGYFAEIRKDLRLSITQLADLFSVSKAVVYDWFEGEIPHQKALIQAETLSNELKLMPPGVDISRLKFVWKIPVSGTSFCRAFNSSVLFSDYNKRLRKKLDELSPKMGKKVVPTSLKIR